jgi:hypothetical protein
MFYLTLRQIPYAQFKDSLVLTMQTKRKEIFRATLTSLILILQNYPSNKFAYVFNMYCHPSFHYFKVQATNVSPTNMFAILDNKIYSDCLFSNEKLSCKAS